MRFATDATTRCRLRRDMIESFFLERSLGGKEYPRREAPPI